MARRITEIMVYQQHARLVATYARRWPNQNPPILFLGNSTHRIHNTLLVGKTNVWPDGMAGTTKADAYNALRIMVAALTMEEWSA